MLFTIGLSFTAWRPARVLRGLQGVGQPEQVALLRERAGARAPELVWPAGQLRAGAVLAALPERPLNVRRDVAREAMLLRVRNRFSWATERMASSGRPKCYLKSAAGLHISSICLSSTLRLHSFTCTVSPRQTSAKRNWQHANEEAACAAGADRMSHDRRGTSDKSDVTNFCLRSRPITIS